MRKQDLKREINVFLNSIGNEEKSNQIVFRDASATGARAYGRGRAYIQALCTFAYKNKNKRDLQNFHLVADFGIDVALDFRTVKSRIVRGDKA